MTRARWAPARLKPVSAANEAHYRRLWPSAVYPRLLPREPSLCWDVKVGWVPVREIDPATGRCYVQGPGESPASPTKDPR